MNGWSTFCVLCVYIASSVFGAAIDSSEKIFNGRNAKPWRFRWAVRLLDIDGTFSCSGSLVLPDVVLTAAHCVPFAAMVAIGDYNATVSGDGEQLINVTEYIPHPKFEFGENIIYADIGLLKLAERADLSGRNAQMVPRLATRADEKIVLSGKVTCLQTGWGFMNRDGRWMIADVLQKMKVTFIDAESCTKIMGFDAFTEDGVCFKARKGPNAAACPGDSGSPLVCRINDQWVQYAVHSWGLNPDGCRTGTKGAIRVSEHKGWLQRNAPGLNY